MKKINKLLQYSVIACILLGFGIEIGRAVSVKRYEREIDEVRMQRDLLSDAIRNAYDNGHQEAMEYACYYLGEDSDSICEWSYCY